MRIGNPNTDAAVLTEIGKRLAQVRLGRNLTQDQLAAAAGVSKRTIERLETGHSVQLSNFVRTLRVLDLLEALDTIIPQAGPSPIDLLKLHQKGRRRASSRRPRETVSGRWTWDDEK